MNFKAIKNLMVTKVYVDKNGKTRCCGGPDLQKSGRYPAGLCLRVAELIQDSLARHPFSKVPMPDDGLVFEDSGSEDSDDSGLAAVL